MTDSTPTLIPDEAEPIYSLSQAITNWLARSFNAREEWKKKAREIFFTLNGDSNATRNRVAAMIRSYFLQTPPKDEDVERWVSNKIETIHVTPPKVTSSNSTYVAWLEIADYVLMPCSVCFEEIDAENQTRENEYRAVYDSYAIRMIIFDARNQIRSNPESTDEEILKLILDKSPKAAMAHVKEARKLERAGVILKVPTEPPRPSLMVRYECLD